MFIVSKSFSEELKIKSSIFKSFIYHVDNIEHIKKYTKLLEKTFPDANHICYAYRICNTQQLDLFYNPEIVEYTTDDGEPSGTAGRQILNVIKNKSLVNRLIIVVRYFGGIKLGIKGLIDAYRESAELVVKDVKLIKWVLFKEIMIKLNYKYHKSVELMILKYDGKILNSQFSEDVSISIKIPCKHLSEFKKNINEKSKGTIQIIGS